MAKAKASETNELATTQAGGGLTTAAPAPAFLQKDAEDRIGVDQTSKYQTINRIAIVQAQSGKQRKEEFGEGAFAMFPDGLLVAEPGEAFVAIPLFFFADWSKWSDYNDDDSQTIIESTIDESHDIARRSKNKATRTEPYGPENKFNYSYVESLNVAVMVDSGPAKGEIAMISLNKSDHFIGRQIASMIQRSGTDIFARRIEFSTVDRNDGKNDWYGFKINNPSEEDGGAWIAEDQYEPLKAMHLETKAAYDANMIVINRDEETGVGGGADGGDDDLPPV